MNNPIHLISKSIEADQICQAMDEKLSAIDELFNLVIEVKVLDNFDHIPEASQSEVIKKTGAFYRKSEKTIYINKCVFFQEKEDIQESTMAHEIGHALDHRDSLTNKYGFSNFGQYGCEFLADQLACRWGFFDGIAKERAISYGCKYVDALSSWSNHDSYLKKMSIWHTQKQAGIL